MSAKRFLPALVATTGFVLICSAALLHQPAPLPLLPKAANAPQPDAPTVTEAVTAPEAPRRSQDGNWYLSGDPLVVAGWIEKLDHAGRDEDYAKEFYPILRDKLYEVLGLNHIHAFPLMERILCDERIPQELKDAFFTAESFYQAPEAVAFLAQLYSSGKVAAAARPGMVAVLSRLTEKLRNWLDPGVDERIQSLLEFSLNSDDPNVRTAAIVAGVPDGERVLLLFRSDPDAEVRNAAASSLRFRGYAAGREDLALETAVVVGRSRDSMERWIALSVLAATETELAKKTVGLCLDDPDLEIRRLALGSAGLLQMTEELPRIARLLKSREEEVDETTRLYGVYALQAMKSPASARLLLQSYDDPGDLRGKYEEALGQHEAFREEALAEDLINAFRKRENPFDSCLPELLAKNGSERTYSLLISAFGSGTAEERNRIAGNLLYSSRASLFVEAHLPDLLAGTNGRYALDMIADSNPSRALTEIERAYHVEKMPEPVREAAVRIVRQIGGARAPALLKLMKNRESSEDLQGEIDLALRDFEEDP